MRPRYLVVSLASPRPRLPSFGLLLLGLALVTAHGPHALAEGPFSLTSASFHNGGTVDTAQVYGQDDCKGGNRSPQLSWQDPPTGTRSFAVTVFDPDAPGRGWWHWAVAGIPATVEQLPENASASGLLKKLGAVEARNDFDDEGYSGPCPPPGKPHHYIVTVYALDTVDLRLAQGRPALMFDHEISTATLGYARMTVTYGR
ncbi:MULTISPECIES: YbhB/YbcL family Raf kinase inhibitor-like protein [Paraburkholderia]|uniref:YbhB/YbcL family Raf kinase inhibitor-like protein n=1 Tax=Paraburkholderia TaxID=1822464 RepID=UPI00225562AA|nr:MULTISPECIES: YbhB/YbcL family Raf kinase inhibitor-like protein [Paraburkholderia]MCX4166142.1 YbhB/YbcL family Raf kinase inhibitor-like protein [Paraburkholderia megapolitana]MDN7161632.1 YbhB/YbcL family Raf kinase inhibitor-like protein [Paraburkholderia sp. CHISQ3]MDQ6498680.1 YbhB/YbcL family Raf kinase inhibitor-like protein [Paraburkholderia megapolitana]